MIVAVTGASGHIGANLVRALLQDKRQVRALIHDHREGIDGLGTEEIRGDICDPYTLHRAFTGADIVYHLAASASLSMNNGKTMEAANVMGTHNVVEACIKCGVRRLVHFSSIQALVQEPLDTPVDESRPLADSEKCPPYDRSKAAGEREVRQGIEQGLDAVILNPTGVIGPYDYRLAYFGEFLLALAQGRLPALIEGGFDWVDARDIATAAINAEKRAPVGAKYLLSGEWISAQELARLTAEITGRPVTRLVIPTWLARTGAPVVTTFNQLTRNRQIYTGLSVRALAYSNHHISHERATRELNYHPRPLRSSLVDTFHWFQESGLLDESIKLKTNPETGSHTPKN